MKKALIFMELLLAVFFLFSSCSTAVGSQKGNAAEMKPAGTGADSDGLNYVIDKENDYVKITGRGDCRDAKIVIPNTIKGHPVTGIASEAFKDDLNLTGITIPDSITNIGEKAFQNCSDLTDISIPNGVTSIENQTFSNCKKLKSVTIPNSVTSIGDSAFSSCESLESITIPSSVTSIGNGVFSNCESLGSVMIPNSVTSIGMLTFFNCKSLVSITIPNSITSIGNGVFSNCESLESVAIPDSVASIGSSMFSGCNALHYNGYDNAKYLGNENNPYLILMEATDSSITTCIISEQTKFIANSALNCYNLKSITIPNSVKMIDSFAFFSMENITYQGTQKEWNAISKADYWNPVLNYTVHCTDGDIVKGDS